MCVVSMVMDHFGDKWRRRLDEYDPTPVYPPYPIGPIPVLPPPYVPVPAPRPLITPEELAELRELLKRAREYDQKNGEPDCELEEKRERLRKLAKDLGVGEIEFV